MTQDEPPAPSDSPERISTQAGAVLDEAAAAFAATEEAGEIAGQPAVDTDIETLVAEIAEGALDTEAQDIAFDPEDTPSVFRELRDLPKSGDQFGAAIDDFVEPATVAFEEAPAAETPSAEVEPENEPEQAQEPEQEGEGADEAERFGAEWGVFESPERPDAPVFGVSFGRQPAEAPPEPESDEALPIDIAPLEPFAGSEPAAAEPEQPDVPLEEIAGDELLAEEPSADEQWVAEETAEPAVTEEVPEPRVELAGAFEEMPAEPSDAGLFVESLPADATDAGSAWIEEVDAVVEMAPDLDGDTEPTIDDVPVEEPAAEMAHEPMPEIEIAEPDAGEPASEVEESVSEIEPEPVEWGSRWQESAQGWVEDEQGRSTWRPIVTTSPLLSEWKIDTYLGVVTADVVLGAGPIETEMAGGRTAAMRAIINDAMARGAHAVVGVTTTVSPVGTATVLTATGTAVTLKAPD